MMGQRFSIFQMMKDKAERVKQGLCTNSVCFVGVNFRSDFRDEISIAEYGISGLCQSCQDDVFGNRTEW